ncbi:MAG: hypothetical protein ABI837_04535, partial [Acidobacteriota bacterium]
MNRLDRIILPLDRDCFARLCDAPRQRAVTNEFLLPEAVEQLLTEDHPVAIANQVEQQIEHARFDPEWNTTPAQLISAGIQLERLKTVTHRYRLMPGIVAQLRSIRIGWLVSHVPGAGTTGALLLAQDDRHRHCGTHAITSSPREPHQLCDPEAGLAGTAGSVGWQSLSRRFCF